MRPFAVTFQGRTFHFDAELLLVLAAERMEKTQCRPHSFLYGDYDDGCLTAVHDYFRETEADISGIDLRDLLDECVRALKTDARFRSAVETLSIDDSEWSGGYCEELQSLLERDFVAHFPQYHNLFMRGLLDREFRVWCVDRLLDAGLPGILHRLPYREQRRLLSGTDLVGPTVSEQMIDFYVAKVEQAKDTIDMDGNRSWWL